MDLTFIIYWASTGLLSLAMLFSAYAYIAQPAMREAFTHLGYPAYFRVELAVAKVVGVLLLLAPVGPHLKEWAYAGFAFTFVSAFIGHSALGDPVGRRMGPVFVLVLLAASYLTYLRLGLTHTIK
jgi:hypothetical protein